MTTEIVDVTYREYTTDGRFITSAGFVSRPGILADDLEVIMDPEIHESMEIHYHNTGVLAPEELLKPIWGTNVTVRHPGTGRFMKWKNI